MEGFGPLGVPVGGVSVPVKVECGHTGLTLGERLGHPQHAVVDTHGSGERLHPFGHLGWKRAQHERTQDHRLENPRPECFVPSGHPFGKRLG